jgi:gamma-glutamylcyclotransferase (GGCT)/AIG2-like uncharacterized protein YtfP
MYLFVYGTLKEGHRNNHYLSNADLIGEFETEPHYRLFDNGNFPMMVEDREDGYSVLGEIWTVDEDDIDEIDFHEALYRRDIVEIRNFEDEVVFAYIYNHRVYHFQECYGQWP